jgi:hypothetical protein
MIFRGDFFAMSEAPSENRASAPIYKRALIEFWPQLLAAICWAAFQAYISPANQISVFISQFFTAFFFR